MELIEKYFKDLDSKKLEQFKQLQDLYTEWNEKINVISRKDIDSLYLKHVLHSMSIAKIAQLEAGSSVLDVGTGGGFPGIPLAILFPEVEFTLVDSIGKKIKVVKAIAESLGLNNVEAHHLRAEKVTGKFDYVVSRAVTRLKPFWIWIQDKIKYQRSNAGLYALKGGDLNAEISEVTESRKYLKVNQYALSDFFEEEFYATKEVLWVRKA